MTDTFTNLAGRAALHKTVLRRSQFSKKIVMGGSRALQPEKRDKREAPLIVCN